MDLHDLNALKQDPYTFNDTKNVNLQQITPPVPPRQNPTAIVSNLTPGYNGYGSQFASNSYSYPQTSGYLGGHSNYSMPYNSSYGLSNMSSLGPNNSNSFLRAAEDSSRSAFQSIESIVYAFSAVSAMFESTYLAVYNSFRAVVGVADQFYRLKTHLTSIVSGLAVLKIIKRILRKVLRFLQSKSAEQSDNTVWNLADRFNDAENLVKQSSLKRQTNWPLIMFFGVVFGGPWLIWKILSSIDNLKKHDSLWMEGKIDHFIAVSEHDFDSVNVDELSFRRGNRIIIAPKEYQPKIRGWLLGTIDGKTQGIMPANYLKVLGKKSGTNTVPTESVLNDAANLDKIYDEI